jgi:hypothetical protein
LSYFQLVQAGAVNVTLDNFHAKRLALPDRPQHYQAADEAEQEEDEVVKRDGIQLSF